MGTTLHGVNETSFDLTAYDGDVLHYLGWGLGELFGVYAPMSGEDCKILARILRNKANYLEIVKDDPEHVSQNAHNVFIINGSKDGNLINDYLNSDEQLAWIRALAGWFEASDGLAKVD